MDVQFGNLKIPSKLAVSGSVKAQLVGMEFIKGFDWIIDNDKNEVWIKRNEHAIPSDFTSRTTYRANTKHGKLYIALKEKSQTKFKLNDQIVSVNAIAITPDNACEYQEILNKSADWNSFEIITAKPAE